MLSNPGSGSPPAASTSEGSGSTPHLDQRCHNWNRQNTNRETKFEGKCTEIKTSVYNVVSRRDTFAKTTREIAEYVGHEFEDAGELQTGMVEMRLMPLTKPTAPTAGNQVAFELWKMTRRSYEKQVKACHWNSYRVYALIFGQCSQAL